MSNKFLSRAFLARTGSPARKMVLVKIADQANDNGEAYPSYQHIANDSEMSRRTAMRHVHELKGAGFLEIRPRLYRDDDGRRMNRSNLFVLTIDQHGFPFGAGVSRDTRGWCQQRHQGGVSGDTQNPHRNLKPLSNREGDIEVVDRGEDTRGGFDSEGYGPW